MATTESFHEQCSVIESDVNTVNHNPADPFYKLLLLSGAGQVRVDFSSYTFSGNTVLFITPYQTVHFSAVELLPVRMLRFHGDFYCIEYHKKEVACNGLLFNNIYTEPFIHLQVDEYQEMHVLFDKLTRELSFTDTYSQAVVRAYLQLMLALSSKVKIGSTSAYEDSFINHPIYQFKALLENNFKNERSPSFYAAQLRIAPNTFSKQCKAYFKRNPSQLIHERVILEAKKLIHLSYKSMKEVAAELNFDDENYFSRYFKKHTGITPTAFREKVGISVVANLSR